MKKEQLEKLSIEDIEKKIKSGTSLLYVSLTLMILYCVYAFYKMFDGTWETGPQIAIPFLILASMLPNYVNLKSLKEELVKRKG